VYVVRKEKKKKKGEKREKRRHKNVKETKKNLSLPSSALWPFGVQLRK
jgi:hypothetical protein